MSSDEGPLWPAIKGLLVGSVVGAAVGVGMHYISDKGPVARFMETCDAALFPRIVDHPLNTQLAKSLMEIRDYIRRTDSNLQALEYSMASLCMDLNTFVLNMIFPCNTIESLAGMIARAELLQTCIDARLREMMYMIDSSLVQVAQEHFNKVNLLTIASVDALRKMLT